MEKNTPFIMSATKPLHLVQVEGELREQSKKSEILPDLLGSMNGFAETLSIAFYGSR